MKFSKKMAILMATPLVILPAEAQAQQVEAEAAVADTGRGLEEIVVTARRRTESLINVPVAASVLSQGMIERAVVRDMMQVAELTPNLIIGSGANGAAIAVRGVGSSAGDPGIEQSVGINVDGVSVGRGRFIFSSQFDLAQIEVLKGPQALFFGKNSPAGVISIKSADPTRTLQAMGRVGYEFQAKERYAEGYVSGPISDTLGFRVAGRYTNMDGWLHNDTKSGFPNLAYPGYQVEGPGSKDKPGTKAYSGRLTLKWDPSSDFSANFKLLYDRVDSGEDSAAQAICEGPAAAIGQVGVRSLGLGGAVVYDPQSDCKFDTHYTAGKLPTAFLAGWPEANKRNGEYYFIQDTTLASLNLAYDFGDVALTSVTGYTNINGKSFVISDHTSFAVVTSAPRSKSRTFSQEFRLVSSFDGPLNFTFGSFFEDSKRSDRFNAMLGFVGFDAANGNSTYTFRNIWRNTGKTYSAFGQLRWKILEDLELAGGVRYTKEKKDTDGQNTYINALGAGAFGLTAPGLVVQKANKFSNWSPEITLSYKPVQNMMVYGAFKTGYKSGGLSTPATIGGAYLRVDPATGVTRPAGQGPDTLAFKPETSKGFEGGIKGELFDRTLRFDVTAYRYTFSNLQLTSFNANIVAYFIRNAGKARTQGLEGSLTWRATRELTITGSSSYTDAKYISFVGAQCYAEIYGTPICPLGAAGSYDRSGQRLPRSPKYTLNGGFDYVKEIGGGLKIGVGGDAAYNSTYKTSETGNPRGDIDGFWKFNANLRVGAEDDKWELALLGRNLTNKLYYQISQDRVLGTAGTTTAYSVRPRQIALQGTVKF